MWPFPTVGFVGYILAFRRGMLQWNPNIDRTWRQYLWLGRTTASEDSPPANGGVDPAKGRRISNSFIPSRLTSRGTN